MRGSAQSELRDLKCVYVFSEGSRSLVVVSIPTSRSLQACAHRKEPRPVSPPGFDQFLINSYQIALGQVFRPACTPTV